MADPGLDGLYTAIFRLDYPPSVNHYWRHVRGKTLISKAGRAYRTAAMGLTQAQFDGPVAVSLDVMFPDRRRRDLDNVCKAVLDAIGYAGIYRDDSQIVELRVKRIGVEPPGCIDVVICRASGTTR